MIKKDYCPSCERDIRDKWNRIELFANDGNDATINHCCNVCFAKVKLFLKHSDKEFSFHTLE